MIDTIVFRIHDLQKHVGLVKYLFQNQIKGVTKYSKEIQVGTKEVELGDYIREIVRDKEQREKLLAVFQGLKSTQVDTRNFEARAYIGNYMVDHQTGRTFEGVHWSHLPSSHYEIAYSINFSAGYIEFNFSIPKYEYFTNVFQFVPHYFDPDYSPYNHETIEQMIPVVWKRFRNFIFAFFDRELLRISLPIDLHEVQICRIDICFNKIFRSEQEALSYLVDVKQIRKKYLRSTSSAISYNRGLMYSVGGKGQKDYTWKVYHKGTEFKVNDRNKLKGKVKSEKLDVIQDLADRTVRYELEVHSGLMNRLFKKYLFRPDSKLWRKAMRYYEQYAKDGWIKKEGKKYYRTPPTADQDGVEYSKKEVAAMKMEPYDWKLVKYGKFYYEKAFHFHLESSSRLAEKNEIWHPEIASSCFSPVVPQRFGRRMFTQCVKQFLVLKDMFSIHYQDEMRYVMGDIEEKFVTDKDRIEALVDLTARQYNIPRSELIHYKWNTLRGFLDLLRENSLYDIKQKGLYGERTFYRYKKLVEKWGFKDFTPSVIVYRPDETYITYFDQVDRIARHLPEVVGRKNY